MKPSYRSSVRVFFSFLLFSFSSAHTESQSSNNNNNNGPLFGSVMRYFGESETGYGLPSSGLFEDADTSQQVSVCLPNFEVSVGSIIRTKDSQALGAHYLNETDLGAKSRDECLKLCCKVSRCNVAVFEEKNSGSCYLFDCGSLEDFRCKFTSQTHYVSAILRHRDAAPQQQHNSNSNSGSPVHQGSIIDQHINSHSHNQHEDELSQLRDSDKTSGGPQAGAIPAAVVAAGASNSADTGSKSKQAAPVEITHGTGGTSSSSSTTSPVVLADVNAPADSSHRCSRWQFECKSSGECIAIYNVCDTIPNCPDGSDEGPELHCPANTGYPEKPSKPKSDQPPHHQPNHHPLPPVPINGAIEKPYIGNSGPNIVPKNQAPLRQNEEYPLSTNMKPQQTFADGNGFNVPRKSDVPGIFKHDNAGLMEEGKQQHYPSWKQQAGSNYDYGNGESQAGYPIQAPPQYTNSLGAYGTNYGNNQYQYGGYSNLQGPQQQSPPQGMPILPQGQPQYSMNNINYGPPQQPYYNRPPPMQGTNAVLSGPVNGQPTGAVQPTNVRNTGVPQQAPNVINPSNQQIQTQATTAKPSTVPQGVPQANSNNKDSLSKLENDFIKSLKAQSLQGGNSDIQAEELSPHTAGAGAVFIFILGLGMSIVMVIIVGCRLRRVGRRQRGKNRLDPDYLVDGMYL